MKRKLSILALLCLATFAPCFGVLIGHFDGLDKLIARSDAIAIVRIDSHINPERDRSQYTTHRGFVYQTLKGDIPAGKSLPLRLMDTTHSFRNKFRLGSTHVVFFVKQEKDKDNIEYRTVQWEGANIEVSPFGNETRPQAETIRQTIKRLIRQYVEFRTQEVKKEDVLLQKVLDG